MAEMRKKRLMQVENQVVLPLSQEFLTKNNLQADSIVNVDEALLAQALTELSKEDILEDVLAKVMNQYADEEEKNDGN
ncbi:hypothetical protein JZO76_06185 [Enterococcus sp. MJM12]|uniref:Phage protein n=2 Tax=Enterococcus TaxID=1350 RepID=A0ABS3H7J0_9ENTE|nr:hypothetical protein [Enterococcus sp. MJM12]MCD1025418.1 hypothetical protein [Enterococcus sp. SMC-9]